MSERAKRLSRRNFLLAASAGGVATAAAIVAMQLSKWVLLVTILAFVILLGFFLPPVSIILMTAPILYPIITTAGFDPIWFGVIITINMEIGLIHPPVGMNVFVIKSVVKDVSFTTIFKGVIPFIITDLIRLVILIAFPILALWLPSRM